MKKLLFLLLLAAPAYADTGFSSTIGVTETDGSPSCQAGQIKFSPGTVTCAGNVATVTSGGGSGMTTRPLPGGDTSYIQVTNTLQAGATFYVSSGTVVNQLNLGQIRWTTVDNMVLYRDGVKMLSMPTAQDTYFGYNTNVTNTGGTFNTSFGAAAMAFPGSGNFNNCVGNSCMSGNILSGENNNAMGYASLGSLSSGFYNAAMGGSALNLLTTGTGNTAMGGYALNHNVSSDGNTGVGYRALFVTTSTLNVGVGYEAGNSTDVTSAYTQANGYGIHNVYLGPYTGQSVSSTTALNNSIAIGYSALFDSSNQAQIGGRPGSGNEVLLRTTSATVEGLTNTKTFSGAGLSSCGDTTHALSWSSASNLFGCQNIPPGGGGGGSSTLAVAIGSSSWTTQVSSPTAALVFDRSQFSGALLDATTAFITVATSTNSQTGNYTAVSTDTVIVANCASACTITLPTAIATPNKVFTVKIIGAGATSIATTAAQTIDGSATITPNPNQWASFDLKSTGANWLIL